jgi:hypothetical protein
LSFREKIVAAKDKLLKDEECTDRKKVEEARKLKIRNEVKRLREWDILENNMRNERIQVDCASS